MLDDREEVRQQRGLRKHPDALGMPTQLSGQEGTDGREHREKDGLHTDSDEQPLYLDEQRRDERRGNEENEVPPAQGSLTGRTDEHAGRHGGSDDRQGSPPEQSPELIVVAVGAPRRSARGGSRSSIF